jgi:hypothetical protein
MRITLIGGLIALFPMGDRADNVSEYSLKAAFIYNFAKFVEWPQETDAVLRLCVLGEDPFGPTLDDLQDKPIGLRKLAVERLPSMENLRRCRILFISESESDKLPLILKAIEGSSALTIADTESFLERGVMIGMTLDDNRITFEVNAGAARRAKLEISSKLLRLAKRVY